MVPRRIVFIAALSWLGVLHAQPAPKAPKVTLVQKEYIFENPPTPSCHASTIVETTPGHWMTAWFGGTNEGDKDVVIWLSSSTKGNWSKPVMMADGVQDDNTRYPCWNPVLFKAKEGKLFLFYKVGPSPRQWWGMVRTSDDNGSTWSATKRLPEGTLGPIKNKPIQLADGTILSASSTETKESWKAHVERSEDLGKTWTTIPVDPQTNLDVIQGSFLQYPGHRIQMLCRSRQDRIAEVWSEDGGKTWGQLTKTDLLNPNSGTDAVTLRNGWQVLVYNPTFRGKEWSNGRQKLNVAMSKDGKNWQDVYTLEDQPKGEFSYPAVVQAADGKIHITYTWERKNIRHIVLALNK